MFAVFQSGGKQHRVSEGDVVRLGLIDGEPGSEIVFDKVLMVAKGDDVEVGSPFVEKGQVTAKIINSHRLVVVVRAYVNINLGVSCAREAHEIKDPAMILQVNNSVCYNMRRRAGEFVERTGMRGDALAI